MIDPASSAHTYVQLADLLEARMRSGELVGKMRAEKDIAEEYGVAYGTVRRTMSLLRDRGLVESIQGRGTFVVPRDRWPAS